MEAKSTTLARSVRRDTHRRHDSDLRWKAAGVRQSLLLRVLSVQRHDVLGPLSVMRMGFALLKRRLDGPSPDVADLRERSAALEAQLVDALGAVAALRLWDAAGDPWSDLRGAAADAVAMLRVAMSLRGHRLEDVVVDDTAEAVEGPDGQRKSWRRPAPDAHYALLGLLACAQDLATRPTVFQLRVAPERVTLELSPMEIGVMPSPLPPAPPGAHALDLHALEWLLADLGARCHAGATAWQLDWPQPTPAVLSGHTAVAGGVGLPPPGLPLASGLSATLRRGPADGDVPG